MQLARGAMIHVQMTLILSSPSQHLFHCLSATFFTMYPDCRQGWGDKDIHLGLRTPHFLYFEFLY